MYDDDEGFEEVMRDETLRCILDEDGAIRCNGECLELALVEERPPPDCSALAEVDWSTLSRGQPIESPEHWCLGYTEEFQLDAAAELLGLDIDDEEFTGPASVREIELDADRGFLTVIELQRGRFALLHGQIALLASRPILPGRCGN